MRALEQIAMWFFDRNLLSVDEVTELRELNLLPSLVEEVCDDDQTRPVMRDPQGEIDSLIQPDRLDELSERWTRITQQARRKRSWTETRHHRRQSRRKQVHDVLTRLPDMSRGSLGRSALVDLAAMFAPCGNSHEAIQILLRKTPVELDSAMSKLFDDATES